MIQFGGVIALALSLTGPTWAEPASFTWATGNFAGQVNVPLALLIGVRVGDRQCAMQLDTGMNGAVPRHGVAESAPDLENRAPFSVIFAGITRTVSVTPAVRKRAEQCAPEQPIASLGNAFFEDGTLTINLVRRDIDHRPGSQRGSHGAAQPFFYARWGDSGGPTKRGDGIRGGADTTAPSSFAGDGGRPVRSHYAAMARVCSARVKHRSMRNCRHRVAHGRGRVCQRHGTSSTKAPWQAREGS